MIRIRLLAAMALAGAVSCGGDATGPSDASITGHAYTLTTINSQALPAPWSGASCATSATIVNGTLEFNADGSYSWESDLRNGCTGGASPYVFAGTWTRRGTNLTLSLDGFPGKTSIGTIQQDGALLDFQWTTLVDASVHSHFVFSR